YGKHESKEAAQQMLLAAMNAFVVAIKEQPLLPEFEAELNAALNAIGDPEAYGVFIRSDTNVEDLENFTGAGLNLTVPNVVGVATIKRHLREVWASPWFERSFHWRQSVLTNPQFVYPSVLLHKTVPAEASGVMLTADFEKN